MGRSYTPMFRIETQGGDGIAPWCWNSKTMGRPTSANLAKVLARYSESCGSDGVNAHIGRSLGRLPHLPQIARIVRQKGDNAGQVVAEWVHPPFLITAVH